ncbi:MAG: T9SS type A sorting domain-containing protein, partial [Candidatus Marinimicrobia bacterium]|nr:T9SS type A sorting domain-containing protein [Candidatus Neomarinimicrobiota bacterium]
KMMRFTPAHTDFVGPEIAGVVAISGTALQVRFSEEVDPVAAAAVANYSIDGGIGNPASVEMVKNNIAVLTIAAIEANAPYTVSVTGVKDLTDLALVDTTVGFKLVDPGELPIDITIDDFETNIGSWFDPNYSGSTSGVLDGSTFEVSDEFAYAGSKSGKMTLLDDPAVEGGWFVRNNNRTEKIAPDSKLFLYLRGADADVQLRFVIWDNGAGGDGYEAGAWNDITVTEDDWQVISIDLASDPVTGWITGNGAINSTDFVTIESIQLRCSEDISTVLYFDMVTERPIVVGIEDVSALPKEFALHQNYPNPFNPITTIKYELPKESLVKIIVFDLMGKEVRTLVSQKQNAGYQTVIWNATDNYGRQVSSGYYIYIMQAESFHKTQKMILLK